MGRFRIRLAAGMFSAAVLAVAACSDAPAGGSHGAATVLSTPTGSPPNVLIYLIDTLRADHVGAYGYSRPTTPHLDRLAAECLLFEDAQAQSPYTASSHATLFTSLYQDTHGVWNKAYDESGELLFPVFSKDNLTMAQAFRRAGYDTAAFTDGGMINRPRNMLQGFKMWISQFEGAHPKASQTIEWLVRRESDAPFFVFTHTYQAHIPLLPEPAQVDRFVPGYDGPLRDGLKQALATRQRTVQASTDRPGHGDEMVSLHDAYIARHVADDAPDVDANREYFIGMYDASIVQADEAFARIREHLESSGQWDETLVIVTSDHGHELWERDRHGHQRIYQEQLHVPLIVKLPGANTPARRSEYIGLIDLMPTVLAACGVEVPPRADGRVLDLLSVNDDAAPPSFASANWPVPVASFRSGTMKAILNGDPEEYAELYDLADGRELSDLAADAQHATLLDEARRTIKNWRMAWIDKGVELGLRGRDALGERLEDLDDTMRDELAELGYIDDEQ